MKCSRKDDYDWKAYLEASENPVISLLKDELSEDDIEKLFDYLIDTVRYLSAIGDTPCGEDEEHGAIIAGIKHLGIRVSRDFFRRLRGIYDKYIFDSICDSIMNAGVVRSESTSLYRAFRLRAVWSRAHELRDEIESIDEIGVMPDGVFDFLASECESDVVYTNIEALTMEKFDEIEDIVRAFLTEEQAAAFCHYLKSPLDYQYSKNEAIMLLMAMENLQKNMQVKAKITEICDILI